MKKMKIAPVYSVEVSENEYGSGRGRVTLENFYFDDEVQAKHFAKEFNYANRQFASSGSSVFVAEFSGRMV